jgi:dienelactone hydrolase
VAGLESRQGPEPVNFPDDPSGKSPGARAPSGGSGTSRELTVATPPLGSGPRRSGGRSLEFGTTLDRFEIHELLGAGGFGEVYRARDARLERMVAVKVLPDDFARDADRRERFRREAMAASALSHPNICTVHDLVEAQGRYLIVMELVEGRTLEQVLSGGPLPPLRVVAFARQIVSALAEAHRAGILHRDIKSGNIVLTPQNQVKVLDFGLAKRLAPGSETGPPAPELTREGMAVGTLTHMSPEQLLGKPLDARSDLFSVGVVLYQMLTGRLPFVGATATAIADSILHDPPRPFQDVDVPERLKATVLRLLEKDPARRYASAEELNADLADIEASFAPARAGRLSKGALALAVVAAVAVAALGAWFWHRAARAKWARETAGPEIARLVAAEDFTGAAALARQARLVLPQDPALEKLWTQATMEMSVESVPAGARVFYRLYRGNPGAWELLGQTPLPKVRVPKGYYYWRIEKPGFETAYQIAPTWSTGFDRAISCRLEPAGSAPAGTVRVPGGKIALAIPGLDHLPDVLLDDFWIDRHEVTNGEYKKFVEAGGYDKPDFWKEPFVENGRALEWTEAMGRFRDATGRPGPATWELGTFAKGMENHPVAGVSWYEAEAYARFAGKTLPTIYHWNHAAQTRASMLIVPGSNFQGAGTVAVGGDGAWSGFGTTDMAGNVKEWCWNRSGPSKRFILGGGFGEPTYMFIDQDAQSPWDRRANYGFRCVKQLASPAAVQAAAPIEVPFRDFFQEKPVSDEVFAAYRGLYAYDRGELNARVEETGSGEDGTRQKVSFNAAYGGERVVAYLFLPKNVAPPYQPIIYFPGSSAIHQDKFSLSVYADWIPRSGRALMCPIYKSTFERRDDLNSDYPEPTAFWRDHVIAWSKDVGRSIDYLETRKDMDVGKLAYVGLSWGGAVAPNILAVESRFRTAVLESGGLEFQRALPEADTINFIPRVRVPLLMLNGRYDHFFPVESSQIPFFKLLGTPEKDKRQVIYETGHAVPRKEFIRESLDWLDRYLGPVRR